MRRAILVVLASLLVACTSADPPSDGREGWTDHGRFIATKTVTISGATCVLVDGYEAAAISCDWRDTP